jgi:hypothetical protein
MPAQVVWPASLVSESSSKRSSSMPMATITPPPISTAIGS